MLYSPPHGRLTGFSPVHHCTTASLPIWRRLQGNVLKDYHTVKEILQAVEAKLGKRAVAQSRASASDKPATNKYKITTECCYL